MWGRRQAAAQREVHGRRSDRRVVWTAVMVLGLVATGCSQPTSEVVTESEPAVDAATTAPEASSPPAAAPSPPAATDEADAGDATADSEEAEGDLYDLDPGQFSRSTVIDATWLPMRPGTRHVYEGTAIEEDEEIDRRVIFIVTDLTKVIGGVEAVVIWERDFNDDLLLESELAFFAQDDDGNVWHLGQYRETYDEDEFVGGRIWVVDNPKGAKAGIAMHANPPQPGTPPYSQGFAPAPFNWTDRAQVDQLGQELCVPVGCYEDVLVTAESDEENPGIQLKYYAPDVGNIGVGFRGDDPEQEELELVERRQLDEAELEQVREEALAHETRGYMYSMTPPAEPSDGPR